MTTLENKIHVALALDNNFAMPCGVSIISICENTPCDITFHVIIADDVTEDSQNKITQIVDSYEKEVKFYSIDESMFENLPDTQYITKTTYFRLLIPEILPNEIEKVLYLDSDITVVRSIQPLWDTDLADDEPAAMAIDGNCSNVTFHNFTGIPLSQPYYNAGVILMNLNCWRRENIGRKCIDMVASEQYQYMDQDAVNVVIGERIKPIPVKYNLQIIFMLSPEKSWSVERDKYFGQIYEAIKEPVVIHYALPDQKPWFKYVCNNEEWLRYKAISPWKNAPLCRAERIYSASYAICYHVSKLNPTNKIDFRFKHRTLIWLLGEILRVINKLLRNCKE